MAALLKATSRTLSSTFDENEAFKQIVLLCAAGLFVSLLLLTYGVDLSPGFF
jgi:hypothetical protein